MLVRQSYLASKNIYDQRAELLRKIPGFWLAVVEESEIELYVQARDIPILQHLISLDFSRFELDEDPEKGDPRSLQFVFRFSTNEYFTDEVLVKRFWHRNSKTGWSGLVSDPVRIHWKNGKDVTGGALDFVVDRYHNEHRRRANSSLHSQKPSRKGKALQYREDDSFFAWFGSRGCDISAEEAINATVNEKDGEGSPETDQAARSVETSRNDYYREGACARRE